MEGVARACVVGVPDGVWGSAVVAVVVPQAGARLDVRALRTSTRGGAKRTAPKAEAKVSTDKKAEDTQAKKKKPALSGMKKAELIEFAKENNIEIDEKATKPVIIEAINKEFE